jgi:hypothetical protein
MTSLPILLMVLTSVLSSHLHDNIITKHAKHPLFSFVPFCGYSCVNAACQATCVNLHCKPPPLVTRNEVCGVENAKVLSGLLKKAVVFRLQEV